MRGAPRLVCLHGVCGHGLRFRRLVEERLAGRFHVRALDLRGHGRSGWEEPWTIERHVDDVLETVERARDVDRAQLRRTPHRRGDGARARARRARRPARSGALGARRGCRGHGGGRAGQDSSRLRRGGDRQPGRSLRARAARLPRGGDARASGRAARRPLLLPVHAGGRGGRLQADGDTPARLGRASGADAPRRRGARQARQRRRARALPRRPRRPARRRRRPGRPHRALGRLRGDGRGDRRPFLAPTRGSWRRTRSPRARRPGRRSRSRGRGSGSPRRSRAR